MAENPPSPTPRGNGASQKAGNGAAPGRGSGPAPSAPEGTAFPEGVPCWIDVQLPDVEAGRRFYGELFGWTFEEAHGSSVWAYLGDRVVAALVPKRDGRMPTVWTVYFAAPDVAALTGRIRAGGGQVVIPPTPVDTLGTAALAADPEGAVFGLWQAGTHAGFGKRHEPGSFTWAQLYARNTVTANTFYTRLFHDALLGPDAVPDFGRAPLEDVFPTEMPPHFLVHFGVRDGAAALAAVGRLGGRVQVPPFETPYGRVAVVTDDQGASFALLQR
ncbi:VOC family protein [Streptomyces colonosanans]|uniref:VOC family protein n=1 Tax=Streptomyces colonosanans TaxID=1428652 RepID=UPI000A83406E|nr:VOC family protein [Streptomyces colonosanans]